MEPFFDFGLEVARQWQIAYPQLAEFFRFISLLGQEEFYLVWLPLIYWCLDKRLGKHLAYVFLAAHGLNSLGKHSFRGPRPFWLDSSVGLGKEVSYGVPSGHTESAMVFYGLLAFWLKRRWMTLLALFMIVAMGLSRIYLGVHFVHDVAAGYLVGAVVLVGYFVWRRYWAVQFSKRILGQRLLAAILVPLGLALVYMVVRLFIGEPDTAVSWAKFIPDAELEGIEAMATAFGSLLGLGIGVNLEASRVCFKSGGAVWKRIVRYLVGMVVTVGLWAGLKIIFPTDPLWLALFLRIVRYTLLLLWVGYYGPLVFVRLGLAEAQTKPDVRVAL